MIIVVTAVILFTYQVAKRTMVYFGYNTTVSVNIRYIEEVPFLAVMLCNINMCRLESLPKTQGNYKYNSVGELFRPMYYFASFGKYAKSTEITNGFFMIRISFRLRSLVTQNKINSIKNCPQWGLNSQPPDHQSHALPTELSYY